MNSKFHVIVLCFFLTIYCPVVIGRELEWTEIENGIWKASVGEPEHISLLKAADIQPKVGALNRLPTAVFPFDPKGTIGSPEKGKPYSYNKNVTWEFKTK